MSTFGYKECNITDVKIESLNGLIIKTINGLEKGSEEVLFHTECGRQFKMFHQQDCCEDIHIDDICGDVEDIIGSVIVQAESRESEAKDEEVSECGTWTFYDIWTKKGSVNIKWLGESNGYYSEDVTFCEGENKSTQQVT